MAFSVLQIPSSVPLHVLLNSEGASVGKHSFKLGIDATAEGRVRA